MCVCFFFWLFFVVFSPLWRGVLRGAVPRRVWISMKACYRSRRDYYGLHMTDRPFLLLDNPPSSCPDMRRSAPRSERPGGRRAGRGAARSSSPLSARFLRKPRRTTSLSFAWSIALSWVVAMAAVVESTFHLDRGRLYSRACQAGRAGNTAGRVFGVGKQGCVLSRC